MSRGVSLLPRRNGHNTRIPDAKRGLIEARNSHASQGMIELIDAGGLRYKVRAILTGIMQLKLIDVLVSPQLDS